jgi:hypothetical protein
VPPPSWEIGRRAGHGSRACGDDVVVPRRLPVRASCPVAQLVGMRTSLEGPAAREGFRAFKEKCSPKWMQPDLHVDGRL